MIHEMKLQPKYFDLVKSGEKFYEIRLFDEKRKQLKRGDTLIFKKEPELTEELKTRIVNLVEFPSFEVMTKFICPKFIGMDGMTSKEIVETYHKFYSPEQETKYGVLAIMVDLKR